MRRFLRFFYLRRREVLLWILSLGMVLGSYLIPKEGEPLTLIASLLGVTALIYLARGHILGQMLTIVFSVLYGIVSFRCAYYGEMITYLGMTAPTALAALISWLRHPYKDSGEVEVAPLTPRKLLGLVLLSAAVTLGFYVILRTLGNANLAVSTLSVATSFFASGLMVLRSPYYALAYGANDVVLILLWILAALEDGSQFPMVICFSAFLLNDIYAFFSWRAMRKRQEGERG